MFIKILSICESNGFLHRSLPMLPKILPPISSNIKDNDLKYKLLVGPIGSLLLNNLKTEWLNSMINHKDMSIFHTCIHFEDTYKYIRNLCLEKVPFGIADSFSLQNKKLLASIVNNDENKRDFFHFFNNNECLRCTAFVDPAESLHTFHQWQRYRRVWWRKFSPTPGRYFTSDAVTDPEDGSQTVEIHAKYPWGTQLVELVKLTTQKHYILTGPDTSQENKGMKGRKMEMLHYITSLTPVSTMFMNTICDSFEELDFQDRKRTALRLHRKLAPYKLAFSIPAINVAAVEEEVKDLADYVTKKLRAINITSLLLPSCSKLALEKQFMQYDEMGVPFTVIINENTLKTGIVYLRSRDTTLKEEVLVKDLTEYVDLLFKNY